MVVKLIKGCSYGNSKRIVRASNPIVEVDEAEGIELLDSGYFKLVSNEAEASKEENDINYIVKPVDFEKMTVSQLKEYANDNKIDLSNLTKKGEIIDCIRTAIDNSTSEIFVD